MGLFDIFKKKKKPQKVRKADSLLAMPMFNDKETFDIVKVVSNLRSEWGLSVTDSDGQDPAIISLDGLQIAISTMDLQIPWSDVGDAIQYAYNWPSAEQDLKNHNSHVIVYVMKGEIPSLKKHIIFSKVLYSIIATSSCIGIYQGFQSLLIPRDQYIKGAEMLKHDQLPVQLWVYLGLRSTEGCNNIYTYGLSSFDKPEMEILDSAKTFAELYDFMISICAYVIEHNIALNHGETIGLSQNQKISITRSKGKFFEEETLKLGF